MYFLLFMLYPLYPNSEKSHCKVTQIWKCILIYLARVRFIILPYGTKRNVFLFTGQSSTFNEFGHRQVQSNFWLKPYFMADSLTKYSIASKVNTN